MSPHYPGDGRDPGHQGRLGERRWMRGIDYGKVWMPSMAMRL
jgi:hypothetical protein